MFWRRRDGKASRGKVVCSVSFPQEEMGRGRDEREERRI